MFALWRRELQWKCVFRAVFFGSNDGWSHTIFVHEIALMETQSNSSMVNQKSRCYLWESCESKDAVNSTSLPQDFTAYFYPWFVVPKKLVRQHYINWPVESHAAFHRRWCNRRSRRFPSWFFAFAPASLAFPGHRMRRTLDFSGLAQRLPIPTCINLGKLCRKSN